MNNAGTNQSKYVVNISYPSVFQTEKNDKSGFFHFANISFDIQQNYNQTASSVNSSNQKPQKRPKFQFDAGDKVVLENYFKACNGLAENFDIDKWAESLKLPREKVKNWYKNRRAKDFRMSMHNRITSKDVEYSINWDGVSKHEQFKPESVKYQEFLKEYERTHKNSKNKVQTIKQLHDKVNCLNEGSTFHHLIPKKQIKYRHDLLKWTSYVDTSKKSKKLLTTSSEHNKKIHFNGSPLFEQRSKISNSVITKKESSSSSILKKCVMKKRTNDKICELIDSLSSEVTNSKPKPLPTRKQVNDRIDLQKRLSSCAGASNKSHTISNKLNSIIDLRQAYEKRCQSDSKLINVPCTSESNSVTMKCQSFQNMYHSIERPLCKKTYDLCDLTSISKRRLSHEKQDLSSEKLSSNGAPNAKVRKLMIKTAKLDKISGLMDSVPSRETNTKPKPLPTRKQINDRIDLQKHISPIASACNKTNSATATNPTRDKRCQSTGTSSHEGTSGKFNSVTEILHEKRNKVDGASEGTAPDLLNVLKEKQSNLSNGTASSDESNQTVKSIVARANDNSEGSSIVSLSYEWKSNKVTNFFDFDIVTRKLLSNKIDSVNGLPLPAVNSDKPKSHRKRPERTSNHLQMKKKRVIQPIHLRTRYTQFPNILIRLSEITKRRKRCDKITDLMGVLPGENEMPRKIKLAGKKLKQQTGICTVKKHTPNQPTVQQHVKCTGQKRNSNVVTNVGSTSKSKKNNQVYKMTVEHSQPIVVVPHSVNTTNKKQSSQATNTNGQSNKTIKFFRPFDTEAVTLTSKDVCKVVSNQTNKNQPSLKVISSNDIHIPTEETYAFGLNSANNNFELQPPFFNMFYFDWYRLGKNVNSKICSDI